MGEDPRINILSPTPTCFLVDRTYAPAKNKRVPAPTPQTPDTCNRRFLQIPDAVLLSTTACFCDCWLAFLPILVAGPGLMYSHDWSHLRHNTPKMPSSGTLSPTCTSRSSIRRGQTHNYVICDYVICGQRLSSVGPRAFGVRRQASGLQGLRNSGC